MKLSKILRKSRDQLSIWKYKQVTSQKYVMVRTEICVMFFRKKWETFLRQFTRSLCRVFTSSPLHGGTGSLKHFSKDVDMLLSLFICVLSSQITSSCARIQAKQHLTSHNISISVGSHAILDLLENAVVIIFFLKTWQCLHHPFAHFFTLGCQRTCRAYRNREFNIYPASIK